LNPMLIAIAGPLTGRTFALGSDPLILGRHGKIEIPDPFVSGEHCSISPEEGRFVLRDLESRSGTVLNDAAIQEGILTPGDQIGVGNCRFLFATGEPPGSQREDLLDSADYLAETTLERPAGAPDLAPAALAAALPAGAAAARAERELKALLQAIEDDLLSLRSTEALARRLFELVFTVSPAGRAALLVLDRSGELETAFHRDRQGATDSFPVSRTLLHKAVGEQVAILAEDVLRTPALGEAASVQAERLRSLLALPVLGPHGVLGLLYADLRQRGPRFDEGHLKFLGATCRLAARALGNVRRIEWLEGERRRLAAALERDMIGESPRMQEVYRRLARAAATVSTVLLRGESGTGKELAARALHQGSPRANRPFVAINCATLTEALLESELFGHEKGAFTGAVERKLGKLEVAHTGTLFLDEVAEMPPNLQAKLLRVLEEKELERIGGTRPIRVDVRVVAATHRDLEQAIRERTFRADLFHRLNVISLTLPALRERHEDIPLLARHFAARFSREQGRPVAGFSPEALACLTRYDWPGNIRELRNAIEGAVALGEGELIVPEDLPEAVLAACPSGLGPEASIPRFHGAVNEYKKRLIVDAVREAGGNIPRAAEILGFHPNALHRLITSLGLRDAIQG